MSVLGLRLHLFFLVFCVFTAFGVHNVQDPHHCHHFDDSTYLVTKKTLSWTETDKYCTAFRGRLPSPRNKNQVDFLTKHIDWKQDKVKRYWIGLTNQAPALIWNWKDGSPLTFANWNKGQPKYDKIGINVCAFVNVFQQHKWGDMTCSEKKDITAVCHLKKHAWSPWTKWSACDCDAYIQRRMRVCGTSQKARVTCPCPGNKTEMRLCSCWNGISITEKEKRT